MLAGVRGEGGGGMGGVGGEVEEGRFSFVRA